VAKCQECHSDDIGYQELWGSNQQNLNFTFENILLQTVRGYTHFFVLELPSLEITPRQS